MVSSIWVRKFGVHQAPRYWGTPVGSPEFVSNLIEERLDEERKLWRSLGCQTFSARGRYTSNAQLRDATIICTQCHLAHPGYAQRHDEGMMSTMDNLLGDSRGTTARRVGPQIGHVANEVRWTRDDVVSEADVPHCVLGVMGRLSAHDC